MRFQIMWYVRPAKAKTSLRIRMTVKLMTEHHLESQSLIGGCTGSSWSTHVKMPHCWKSHVKAQFLERTKRHVEFVLY